MRTHDGFTLWFTGLSGAGKSTLAECIRGALIDHGHRAEVLDGDDVRRNLSNGLGFSKADRDTNVRRIGFVSRLLSRNGIVAIAAAISPYRAIRDEIRRDHEAPFVEVFVDCRVDELVRRDTKGLYAKAIRGDIRNFTGISDPYEPPIAAEITIRTDCEPVHRSLAHILEWLDESGLMYPKPNLQRPVVYPRQSSR